MCLWGGGGWVQSVVYSIMWHLWYRGAGWLITLTTALTALHRLAFWPYRWEITSTAERMIGGKQDGTNLLSHYHSPVTKHWLGGLGRDKTMQRTGGRKRREGLINKERRTRASKTLQKREPELRPNSDVYFIWGGRCAGCATSHCFSGPFSLAVWLASR